MRLIRQLASGTSILVLAASSVMTLAAPSVAQAAPVTLYWCNTAGSGTVDFNTAANWNTNSNCSGGTAQVPANGNALVFDSTNLTADLTVNNDINSLDIASMAFSGTSAGNHSYNLTGNAIQLDSGIAVASGNTPDVGFNITLTGNQSITGDGTLFYKTGMLTVGSNTLTIGTGSDTVFVSTSTGATVVGTGTVTVSSGTGLSLGVDNPNWTGTVNVLSGGSVTPRTANSLGGATSNTIINSGADMAICDTNNMTVSNNITLGGPDAIQAQCQGIGPGFTNNNATFTGTVTLTANTTVLADSGGVLKVAGPLHGAFTLTLDPASSGSLVIDSSDNTSDTPNTGGGSGPAAPGTPDTGFAAVSAHPAVTLGIALLAAGMLIGLARKNGRAFAAARAKARR